MLFLRETTYILSAPTVVGGCWKVPLKYKFFSKNNIWLTVSELLFFQVMIQERIKNESFKHFSEYGRRLIGREFAIETSEVAVPRTFYKIGAIKNFGKFERKYPCQSHFLNKVAELQSSSLLTRRLRRRCFPVTFSKFSRSPFS